MTPCPQIQRRIQAHTLVSFQFINNSVLLVKPTLSHSLLPKFSNDPRTFANQLGNPVSFGNWASPGNHTVTWHPWFYSNLLMPSDGVVWPPARFSLQRTRYVCKDSIVNEIWVILCKMVAILVLLFIAPAAIFPSTIVSSVTVFVSG